MRIFYLILLFSFAQNRLLAECNGYPCDTIWYNDQGELKDFFVANEVRFELGRTELVKLGGNAYMDSVDIIKMYKSLDSLAEVIKNDGGIFEIQLHGDCRISPYASSSPTQRRAQAVCDYLILQGVDSTKLIAKGYSDSRPRIITDNGKEIVLTCAYINSFKSSDIRRYEQLHQLNRRLTVKRFK